MPTNQRRRIKTTGLLTLLLLIGLSACDKPATTDKSGTVDPTSEATGDSAASSGKFSVELKISGSQEVYKIEGAPKPEEVQESLSSALYKQEAIEKDGPRKLKGVVNYDIKMLPDDAGYDILLLGALNSPGANFDAGVNVQSTDEKWKEKSLAEMVDGAVAEFATRIGGQARVIGGDDENLGTILENVKENETTKLMAIQEIRERRDTKHLELVRGFLAEDQPPKLRLAACATLVSLGDTTSRTEILKVAEDFSRDRNPQFVPMLHILGDLGGTEVTTYLETVADAHAAPAVRTVAQEVLDKARAKGTAP